jgi:hypothetical protein
MASEPDPTEPSAHATPDLTGSDAAMHDLLTWSVGGALREGHRLSSRDLIECVKSAPEGTDAAPHFALEVARKRVATSGLAPAIERTGEVLASARSGVLFLILVVAALTAFGTLPTALSPTNVLYFVAFGPLCFLYTLIQLLLTTWRRRPAPGTAKPIRGKWLHWLLSFIAKRLLARDEELAVAPPEQRRMLVRAATGYLSDPIEGPESPLNLRRRCHSASYGLNWC